MSGQQPNTAGNNGQGIPTGPLLAQKVVQLPNQKAAEEQKMFRNGGKIKLDRLAKKQQEMH